MGWNITDDLESYVAGVLADPALIDDRLGYGGIALWELDGRPVAMAGRTKQRVPADRLQSRE